MSDGWNRAPEWDGHWWDWLTNRMGPVGMHSSHPGPAVPDPNTRAPLAILEQ